MPCVRTRARVKPNPNFNPCLLVGEAVVPLSLQVRARALDSHAAHDEPGVNVQASSLRPNTSGGPGRLQPAHQSSAESDSYGARRGADMASRVENTMHA